MNKSLIASMMLLTQFACAHDIVLGGSVNVASIDTNEKVLNQNFSVEARAEYLQPASDLVTLYAAVTPAVKNLHTKEKATEYSLSTAAGVSLAATEEISGQLGVVAKYTSNKDKSFSDSMRYGVEAIANYKITDTAFTVFLKGEVLGAEGDILGIASEEGREASLGLGVKYAL